MVRPLRFSQLSPQRQALVRLCQSTNYGQIQDLIVRDREPILAGPPPVVLADIRLGAEEHPRDELAAADFVLCAEVARLMSLLDKIGAGKISKIEVRAGIPRRVIIETRFMEAGELIGEECSAVACRKAGRI
jgi:hypothetical protein